MEGKEEGFPTIEERQEHSQCSTDAAVKDPHDHSECCLRAFPVFNPKFPSQQALSSLEHWVCKELQARKVVTGACS